MIAFSQDPAVAERQMEAVIFYLTTFGYIDGDFDRSEKVFVREYIQRLVEHRVDQGAQGVAPEVRRDLVQRFTTHFHEVFEDIDRYVADLFTEAVAKDEDTDAFVHAKLKLRCFEICQGFDSDSQEALMETIDQLIEADGQVHPAEVKFRGELAEILEADLGVELMDDEGDGATVSIAEAGRLPQVTQTHPFFDRFEFHYASDPELRGRQAAGDRELIAQTQAVWQAQRQRGAATLRGAQKFTEFRGQDPFLDDHVYVHPLKPGANYELTVLGDLHGCYSCLKAAIMQSRFFERVESFQKDPTSVPQPKLVLLGDYIDRGKFSLNGVLRTVMQLAVAAPEYVCVLRGNHEYYVEYEGQIYGGVKPAESINSLKGHLSLDVFRDYRQLFEEMPNMLAFGEMLFVHGGIPRDRLVKQRWKDLSALNDEDVRFQMMWSDPSTADVIPATLQEQSARFPFGRLQAKAFLQRIGCTGLIRGHEKVKEGFRRHYQEDGLLLATLFSAGGENNRDLPDNSSYRGVTPMALTIRVSDETTEISPWEIDFRAYNDPDRNAFFKVAPELVAADA